MIAKEEQVIPHFYLDFVRDETKSKLAGRPILTAVERVTMTVGTDRTFRPVFKVEDKHRNRWPEIYRQFREAIPEGFDSGIELRGMPGLSLKREAELKAAGCMFVEHLLTGTDEEARRRFGPDADKLRKIAIEYMRGDLPPVDKTAGAAPAPVDMMDNERDRLREELKARGVKVDARWGIARLRKELEG